MTENSYFIGLIFVLILVHWKCIGKYKNLIIFSFILKVNYVIECGGIKMTLPNCPNCNSEYTYEDGLMLVCPACAHEWSREEEQNDADELVVRDANGNQLTDGDTVTVIKDLKVKGSSQALKQGTKVKNIRLVEGDHNIDCKIDGFGAMQLKSEFVKKI